MFGISLSLDRLRKKSPPKSQPARHRPDLHEVEKRTLPSSFNAFPIPTPSRIADITAGPDGNLSVNAQRPPVGAGGFPL
jgi:hypothetical protein